MHWSASMSHPDGASFAAGNAALFMKGGGRDARPSCRILAGSLLQLIVALGIFAVLATVAFRAYSNARASAVASVLLWPPQGDCYGSGRYRVDHHAYPAVLDELYPTYTKSEEALRCPEENRPDVRTYSDFYVPRDPKEQQPRPPGPLLPVPSGDRKGSRFSPWRCGGMSGQRRRHAHRWRGPRESAPLTRSALGRRAGRS